MPVTSRFVRMVLSGSLALLILTLIVAPVMAQQVQSISWSSSEYFQGDNGSVMVTLTNQHSFQICTKQLSLQFDWQQAQNVVWASLDTPCIATGQSYTFTIQFSIPSSTSVGDHSYTIVWEDKGFLVGTTTVASSANFYVHDANEKVYDNLAPQVSQGISAANAANYQSPTAQSDLSQAVSYYNQGVTLANQGQFQSAVGDMNQAQTYLSQAQAAESTYQPPSTSNTSSSNGSGGSAIPEFPPQLLVTLMFTILLIGSYLLIRRHQPASH